MLASTTGEYHRQSRENQGLRLYVPGSQCAAGGAADGWRVQAIGGGSTTTPNGSMAAAAGSQQPPSSGALPHRPGAQKCSFYLKTGQCKFGDGCRYDHPPGEGGTDPTLVGRGGGAFAAGADADQAQPRLPSSGVYFRDGAWNAAIQHDGKIAHLGQFPSAEAAAHAWDLAAMLPTSDVMLKISCLEPVGGGGGGGIGDFAGAAISQAGTDKVDMSRPTRVKVVIHSAPAISAPGRDSAPDVKISLGDEVIANGSSYSEDDDAAQLRSLERQCAAESRANVCTHCAILSCAAYSEDDVAAQLRIDSYSEDDDAAQPRIAQCVHAKKGAREVWGPLSQIGAGGDASNADIPAATMATAATFAAPLAPQSRSDATEPDVPKRVTSPGTTDPAHVVGNPVSAGAGAAQQRPASTADFVPAPSNGSRESMEGHVYKYGPSGVGYYRIVASETVSVSAASVRPHCPQVGRNQQWSTASNGVIRVSDGGSGTGAGSGGKKTIAEVIRERTRQIQEAERERMRKEVEERLRLEAEAKLREDLRQMKEQLEQDRIRQRKQKDAEERERPRQQQAEDESLAPQPPTPAPPPQSDLAIQASSVSLRREPLNPPQDARPFCMAHFFENPRREVVAHREPPKDPRVRSRAPSDPRLLQQAAARLVGGEGEGVIGVSGGVAGGQVKSAAASGGATGPQPQAAAPAQAPVAAPQPDASATATRATYCIAGQTRIQELRMQARGLMDQLPSILKSEDGNAAGFCKSVLPALMHHSTATIGERLRNGVDATPHASASSCEHTNALLDIRQFKSWDEALGSIGEALSKCIQTASNSTDAHQDAGLAPARNGASSPWSRIENSSWQRLGGVHANVVADGNTLRLASCRKCSKVMLRFISCPVFCWGPLLPRE